MFIINVEKPQMKFFIWWFQTWLESSVQVAYCQNGRLYKKWASAKVYPAFTVNQYFINDLGDEIEIVLIKFANEVNHKVSAANISEGLGFETILNKEVRGKMLSMPTIHGRSNGFRFHLFSATFQQEG